VRPGDRRWFVRVTWPDGEEELAHRGIEACGPVASFISKSGAEARAEFLRDGIDPRATVAVVQAPIRRGNAS